MSDQLEIRQMQVRETDSAKREFTGIAVPWDSPATIGGYYTEQFARGAVQDSEGAKIWWRHNEPIGKITAARDTDAGWEITAVLSQTPRGDEAYTLLRDGVVDQLSVGFRSIEHTETEGEDGSLTVTRTNVQVREVSLVPNPAYAGAAVTQVRSSQKESNTMPEDKTPEPTVSPATVTLMRESIDELTRRFDVALSERATQPDDVVETRSAGELLKAIASGDEDAARSYADTLERAYSGGTSADAIVKKGWVGDLTRLVDEAAGVRGLFATGTLPAEGNYLEYGQLKSDTSTVEKQVKEGDNLKFGKVSLTTETAKVETYGGYTSLTLQQIQRSSTNILDASLRAQAIAAGKAMNAAFRAHYATAVAAQITAENTVRVPGADATYVDWLDAVVDAAIKFEEENLTLDALVVDPTYFKAFNRFEAADGRPLFTVSGTGANTVGSLDVKTLKGDLASIPVRLNAKQATAGAAFINGQAIRTYASPTTRLQDENVINLSKDFSVYFYAAIADEIPAGIIPVTRGA